MTEELGKIEKPPVEQFKKGRKLYFVPLLYGGEKPPEEYASLLEKYWEQVAKQMEDLELKLGSIRRLYHELIAVPGEEGSKTVKELNEMSFKIIKACLDKGASLEAVEDADLLAEFMDWSRCLIIGLESQKAANLVYQSYEEAGKRRNEIIAGRINETLDSDEAGILLMRENHRVQFPPDIQVFYIAPPALDEIKRWLRDHEAGQAKGDGEST
jgi:hypothetical protein